MKKTIRNLIVFILLIVLTFYIILKDQDVTEIYSVFLNVNKKYIIIAIVCMCLYFVCDAINNRRMLKALNENSSFLKNIRYTLIGFFFSSITPAATGGQPMQVYYMYKDKISAANSTLTLLINLTCAQIVTISFAFFSLIFNHQYLNGVLTGLFILGISLNSTALTLWLMLIFSKRISKWLINVAVKILKFFRVKNIDGKKVRMEEELEKYQESAKHIKSNISVIIKNLLTTYLQFTLYYSISFWVYRSFGLSNMNAFQIITMQSILYATVSGIPSPGAVGASEGGYLALYATIYPGAMLSSAMLLTRAVNFYLFVAISALIVIINTMRGKKDPVKLEDVQKEIEGK